MKQKKTNMKKLQLELGGKIACIIFRDANLAMAAARTAFSMAFLSGQTFSNTRILVEKSAANEFLWFVCLTSSNNFSHLVFCPATSRPPFRYSLADVTDKVLLGLVAAYR